MPTLTNALIVVNAILTVIATPCHHRYDAPKGYRLKSGAITLLAALLLVLLAACGGDSESEPDLADRLTQQAGSSPLSESPASRTQPPSTVGSPSSVPASTVTVSAPPDAATVLQIRTLGTLVLTEQDLPADSIVQSRQGAFRDDVIAAQRGVPPLADYLAGSSLRGSWAVLFAQAGPPTLALNSVVFLFADDTDAAGFVEANASLEADDYAGATAVELLPSPDIADSSTLIRVTTGEGGSLELTWAQGPMAGQIILRYSGEDEPVDGIDRITALAASQADRMSSFLPR